MGVGLRALGWAARSLVRSALERSRLGPRHDVSFASIDLEGVLQAALSWLARSQDVHGGQGSAKAWHVLRGWLPPYPETTGYLIPTLYDAAEVTRDRTWADRAERMARWELAIQLPNGAWPGNHIGIAPAPVVFNTGQVVFGMLRAHTESGIDEFLNAACRAGEFLVGHQDADGAWRRHSFSGIAHAYHARVAWALLLLGRATGERRYSDAARRNLLWCASRQNNVGWFAENIFKPGQLPNTHGICYVTQSLVECGVLANEPSWIDSAARAADRLLEKFETRGIIAGYHDERFRDVGSFECVTGNIQAAITWLRLYHLRSGDHYRSGALRMITRVRSMIAMHTTDADYRGAVPGSWPLHGRYAPLQFPNWATKFWVDVLLLAMATLRHDSGDPLGPLSLVFAGRNSG